MVLQRLRGLPFFDHREMVRTHRVLQDIEPKIAFFLAAVVRQLAKQVRHICALATDIDVCDHECAAAVRGITRGAQRQSLVRTLVVIAQTNRVDLRAKVFEICRCVVGIEIFAVRPGLDDAKVRGACRLLEELNALKSFVFTARVAILLESGDGSGSGRRGNIDVGDGVGAAGGGSLGRKNESAEQ